MGVPGRVSWLVAWLIDAGGLVWVNAGVSNWGSSHLDGLGGGNEHDGSNAKGLEHFSIKL